MDKLTGEQNEHMWSEYTSLWWPQIGAYTVDSWVPHLTCWWLVIRSHKAWWTYSWMEWTLPVFSRRVVKYQSEFNMLMATTTFVGFCLSLRSDITEFEQNCESYHPISNETRCRLIECRRALSDMFWWRSETFHSCVRLTWYTELQGGSRPREGTCFLFPETVFILTSNSTTLKCILQKKTGKHKKQVQF